MPGEPTIVRFTKALHDGVVRAYPRTLEPEFRAGIETSVTELLTDAHARRGWRGVVSLWPGLFGDVVAGLVASHLRDLLGARRPPRLEPFWMDIRQGVRAIARTPASSASISALLVVAVTVQTLVVATVDGVLLRPLPYDAPDRLITLHEVSTRDSAEPRGVSPGNFLDWRAACTSCDALAASATSTLSATTAAGPVAVNVTRVTADYFRVFSRRPAAGRTLGSSDFEGAVWHPTRGYRGAAAPAVLSHRWAVHQFGTPEGAIGGMMELEGRAWQVVGVMDPRFNEAAGSADVWLPWDLDPSYRASGLAAAPRTFRFLNVHGRLTADATLEGARAELTRIASALAQQHPSDNRGWTARLSLTSEALVASFAPTLLAVSFGVELILVLAAANVASLAFSRNLARSRSFAIRTLLGATRRRVFRQLVTEAMLLVTIAALAGIALADLALAIVVQLLPEGTPRIANIVVDARTGWLTLSLAAAFGLVLAIATHLQVAPDTHADRLREISTALVSSPRSRARTAVVTVQVALAMTIAITGALIVQSLIELRRAPLGFDGNGVTVARVAVDRTRYDAARTAAFFADLMAALQATPGVASAGAVTALPLSDVGADFHRPYWPEGRPPAPGDASEVRITMVTPGYFQTLGIPVLSGRDASRMDQREGPRVILVNRRLADRVWPGAEAVGRRLVLDYRGGAYAYEVIGVVGETLHDGARQRPAAEIFIPHSQNPYPLMNVVIRSALEPEAVGEAVSRALRRLDPALRVQSSTTMTALQDRSVANERIAAELLLYLSVLSIVIATVGLYGVVRLTVWQRRREIALRLALGATRSTVYGMFLWWSLGLVVIGCTAGLAGGLIAARQIAPLLFAIGPDDPSTLLGAFLAITVISTAAIVMAVRRAASLDPATLLRST